MSKWFREFVEDHTYWHGIGHQFPSTQLLKFMDNHQTTQSCHTKPNLHIFCVYDHRLKRLLAANIVQVLKASSNTLHLSHFLHPNTFSLSHSLTLRRVDLLDLRKFVLEAIHIMIYFTLLIGLCECLLTTFAMIIKELILREVKSTVQSDF